MKYRYLFFDLDGTLTDSALGISNSVKYALKKMHYAIPSEATLRKFVGPPLSYSFRHFCQMDEETAQNAVATYREYFSEKGLFENEVYEGIVEMLKELKACGWKLVVATSKPEKFSVQIMEHFRLDSYFEYIAGSSMDETRNTKEKVIRYAMEQMKISGPEEVLMIGDREHDVIGAAACGITCLGVLWGYGSEDELINAGAFAVADSPDQVKKYC